MLCKSLWVKHQIYHHQRQRCAQPAIHYSLNTSPFALTCFPGSNHTILFSVSGTQQACSCLNAFYALFPPAWNSFLKNIHMDSSQAIFRLYSGISFLVRPSRVNPLKLKLPQPIVPLLLPWVSFSLAFSDMFHREGRAFRCLVHSSVT